MSQTTIVSSTQEKEDWEYLLDEPEIQNENFPQPTPGKQQEPKQKQAPPKKKSPHQIKQKLEEYRSQNKFKADREFYDSMNNRIDFERFFASYSYWTKNSSIIDFLKKFDKKANRGSALNIYNFCYKGIEYRMEVLAEKHKKLGGIKLEQVKAPRPNYREFDSVTLMNMEANGAF